MKHLEDWIDATLTEIENSEQDDILCLAERLQVSISQLQAAFSSELSVEEKEFQAAVSNYTKRVSSVVAESLSNLEKKEHLPEPEVLSAQLLELPVSNVAVLRQELVVLLVRNDCALSAIKQLAAVRFQQESKDGDTDLELARYFMACLGVEKFRQCLPESSLNLPDRKSSDSGGQVARIVHSPMRRQLPDTRATVTHKFNVAGHEGYISVGLYEDGMPGELFLTMAKEGSTIGGLMDSLGTAVSAALQYGVPVQALVTKFTHQRFEPAGMTTNREIPFAKSLVDYIFRWIGIMFIPGFREANPGRTPNDERSLTVPEAMAQSHSVIKRAEKSSVASRELGTTLSEGDRPAAESSGKDSAKVHTKTVEIAEAAVVSASISAESMNDAPPCDVCGEITVRNGNCYKCLSCGNSMGCS